MRNTSPVAVRCSLIVAFIACASLAMADPNPTDALIATALRYSPAYTATLLRDDGSPVSIIRDFNTDGSPDVALLSMVSDPRIAPKASSLSSLDRLYTDAVIDPTFILEIYFSGQDAIITAEIGRRRMWTKFDTFDFSTTSDIPGIRVGFRSRFGESTEVVAFQSGSVSRFTLENNRNEHGYLIDVDNDGELDVVTARRAPEAGRGYETFLELHRLGVGGFQRDASVGLVRLVTTFLTAAAHDMESEAWPALEARFDVTPSDDELASAFIPVADDETEAQGIFDYPRTGIDITRVLFSPVADNPFPPPFLGTRFQIVFRVECGDEMPRLFSATVGLSSDPFNDQPIAFLTDGEARQ